MVFFLLAWQSIRMNSMLCSCFVRQFISAHMAERKRWISSFVFSPWHNPNKLALPFSFATRDNPNKFGFSSRCSVGLASAHMAERKRSYFWTSLRGFQNSFCQYILRFFVSCSVAVPALFAHVFGPFLPLETEDGAKIQAWKAKKYGLL